MNLKMSQIVIAAITAVAVAAYGITQLIFNNQTLRDPLPSAHNSLLSQWNDWKPKRVPKPLEDPTSFYTVDIGRLKEFNQPRFLATAKEGQGLNVLTGRFRYNGYLLITEPFEGVIVRLLPEQNPYKAASILSASYEVLWYVPIVGNDNGAFRQHLADRGLTLEFSPKDCAAILNWTKPGLGKPGTISVISLRWRKYLLGDRLFAFTLDDPQGRARETEREQLKSKIADLVSELKNPNIPAARIDEISKEADRIKARQRELDVDENNDK
jgi:hypothetical protein